MNKQLTKDEIQLINKNSPKFNFSFYEIMSFKNKINIYIVDRNYLIHRGINQIFLNNCILSYLLHNRIKYLYFFESLKLFKIEPIKVIKMNNNSIGNNVENFNLTKKENIDYKNKINELENKIKKLELIIREKDNIINVYKK